MRPARNLCWKKYPPDAVSHCQRLAKWDTPFIMKYFVVEKNAKQGPYDLMGIIRKVRNGSVTADTLVQEGENAPKPAIQIAKLADVFEQEDQEDHHVPLTLHQHTLSGSIKTGWQFFQNNQISTVHTGVLILFVISLVGAGYTFLPGVLQIPFYVLIFIIAHFSLSVYMFIILRMSRGQTVEFSSLSISIRECAKSLLIASCIIALPSIIGLFLLIVPGLFILTLYIFTPFLIMDHQYDFWEAMETSRKMVIGSGTENLGIVFALVVINFVAAIVVFLPLLITLPVTMSALAEMYEELFSS